MTSRNKADQYVIVYYVIRIACLPISCEGNTRLHVAVEKYILKSDSCQEEFTKWYHMIHQVVFISNGLLMIVC